MQFVSLAKPSRSYMHWVNKRLSLYMFFLFRSIFPIDSPICFFTCQLTDWLFLLNVYLAPFAYIVMTRLLGGKSLRSSKKRPIIGRKTSNPYFQLLINQSKPFFTWPVWTPVVEKWTRRAFFSSALGYTAILRGLLLDH